MVRGSSGHAKSAVQGRVGGSGHSGMAFRGRSANRAPRDTIRRLAGAVGADLADDGDDQAANRREGRGGLLGSVNGLGAGAVYGAIASRQDRPLPAEPFLVVAATMIASSLTAARLGVTDPRAWSLDDSLTDVVPNVGFGLASGGHLRRVSDTGRDRRRSRSPGGASPAGIVGVGGQPPLDE